MVADRIADMGMAASSEACRRVAEPGSFANNEVVRLVATTLQPMLPAGIVVVHAPARRVMHYHAGGLTHELTLQGMSDCCAEECRPLTLHYTPGHVDLMLSSLDLRLTSGKAQTTWHGWTNANVMPTAGLLGDAGLSIAAGMRHVWHSELQCFLNATAEF